jgi:phospholipid/cholesterol/gamma-HCH transport system substrate-binding protein
MLTREQKQRLGIFLVVSIVLLIVILGIFILPKLKEEGNKYFISFKGISVYGLNEGSNVKYQGVDIGKVREIEVNSTDLSSILVEVRINKSFPVKKDMRAQLSYAGITGLKFVELSGGKSASENLAPGGVIPMKRGLGEKAEDIVSNIDKAVKNINKLLGEDREEEISRILGNIEESTAMLKSFIQEQRVSMARSLENIEKFSRKVSRLSDTLDELDIGKIAEKTEKLVDNLSARFSDEELGKALKDADAFFQTSTTSVRKIEGTFLDVKDELNKTLVGLRESLENLARFSRNLSEDPTILIRTRKEKRRKK